MLVFRNKIVEFKDLYLQFIVNLRQNIRKYKYSANPIIKSCVAIVYILWNGVRNIIRICKDTNFRSILLVQLLNSKNLHQTTSLTFMDRYPTIFSACREYFTSKEHLRILSYGCSTGEEVLTLRKYFRAAHIIGAEINNRSLAICKKLSVDDKTTFIYSTNQEIKKQGPFDIIFCMAVLQREPQRIAIEGIKNLKSIYPFEKFEHQIVELDELVKPQGLLVLHFTQYALADTSVGYKYKALNYTQDDYNYPVFDKNSNLVKNTGWQKSIFVKIYE